MEILIAEDDDISRSLLKKTVQEMGHVVLEAVNGLQAWNLIQARKSRLMITDWMMPDLDGLELCTKIRNSDLKEYTYIIILTARDCRKDVLRVLQAGADDYVSKPFDPEELRARVMTGLRILGLEEKHQKLQQTLVESRNNLRIVLDSLQEQIVSLDHDLVISSANQAFCTSVAREPRAVVGRNIFEMPHQAKFIKTQQADIRKMVDHVLGSNKVRTRLVREIDSRGIQKDYHLTCLPIRTAEKTENKAVLVIKDISEESRKTDEIRALNQRLIESAAQMEAKNTKLEMTLGRLEETQAQMLQSEKMASIGQLAAGVAHEINNPTGFVSSNLKTLQDYFNKIQQLIGMYHEFRKCADEAVHDPRHLAMVHRKKDELIRFEEEIELDYVLEDISDLIGDCREGTARIKKIVLDLKDFAHPGEDQIQSTDINKGLESTLNVVNNEIKYKASVHKDFGVIPMVRGYPQQLNQVFMNILVNAAQAMEKKGEIRITTRQSGKHVEITIADTGSGIAPEHLPKIFDPFFTTKDVGKGTGLGLHIAYNIIQKHHGTIEVQSRIGQGTSFKILIPSDPAASLE